MMQSGEFSINRRHAARFISAFLCVQSIESFQVEIIRHLCLPPV